MRDMNAASGTKALWMCACEDTFMSLNLIMENEKCRNSDMRLSFLGIDCTDFIQTGHDRKLVFTLCKKNAVKFLITALFLEIFQSKVYVTSFNVKFRTSYWVAPRREQWLSMLGSNFLSVFYILGVATLPRRLIIYIFSLSLSLSLFLSLIVCVWECNYIFREFLHFLQIQSMELKNLTFLNVI